MGEGCTPSLDAIAPSAGTLFGVAAPRHCVSIFQVSDSPRVHSQRLQYWTGDAMTLAQKISHDLRSPLGAISTSSELLAELVAASNEGLASVAKGIETSAGEGLELVRRVVTVLRATYGGQETWEPIHVGLCVDQAKGANESARRKAGAEIVVPEHWPTIPTVGDWLSQVWTLLISNAIRYGGKRIELGWESLGDKVRFWVRDNGPGLSPKEAGQPFPAFEKLHETRHGKGLGLSMVRRFLELLQGAPRHEKRPDGQTEFSFILPAIRKEPRLAEPSPAEGPPPAEAPVAAGRVQPNPLLGAFTMEVPSPHQEFDTTLALVRRMLGVPVAMISMNDEDVIIECAGLEEVDGTGTVNEEAAQECAALCQRVVESQAALTLPKEEGNLLRAVLGVPIRRRNGSVVGCLCVADTQAREWTADDHDILDDFALLAQKDLLLRDKRRWLAAAVRRLREDEMLQTSLLENSGDCIKLLDREGRIININTPGLRLLEVPELQTVVGTEWASVWPEESRHHAHAAVRNALEGHVGRFRGFCPTAKGTPKWWDVLVTGVIGENGGVEQILCISRDITSEKEAELNLKENEQKFRTLADHMAQLAWMADARGEIYWYNRRWFEHTGTTPDSMRENGWEELLHPEHSARVKESLGACIRSGTAWDETFPLLSLDGGYRWFLSRAVPIRDDTGAVIQWFGTHTDISEQLEAELALRKASQAKDDFIAVLSHELRTPLNPVLLIASAATGRDDLQEEVRQDFDVIRKNVEMEARMIDDLLDMTRILRGKMPLVLSTITVDVWLAETLSVLKSEAASKGIQVVTDFVPERLHVRGDEMRLRQVLWNVLHNAMKFTPTGGTVHIGTQAEGGRLRIAVRDTGIGMSPAEIARIFDPFTQGDHSAEDPKRRFGGLGLGLAISRLLMEQHGGSIAAASEGQERGSTLTIELPLSEESASPEAKPAEPGTEGEVAHRDGGPLEGLRILLIEDHDATRETLAVLLRRRGHEIVPAATVEEGYAAAFAGHYDLLMSDIGLPDGRGDELMSRLRAEGFAAPAIALSGYGMESDVMLSRQAGFGIHLTKPVSIQDLDWALSRVTAFQGAPRVSA